MQNLSSHTQRPFCSITVKLDQFFNFAQKHSVKAFLSLWLVMFALWLPYLFAFWSSVWAFDAYGYSSGWLLRGETLNSWHPVLHVLLLSLPITASWNLFGNYVVGAAFYSIVQMLILSGLFTKIVLIVARWKFSKYAPVIIWFAFTLFPLFPFWSMIATKDVIFSGLFALSCACIADFVIRNPLHQFENRTEKFRYILSLWILFLLTAMFRNNAVYGFILFGFLLLIFGRKLLIKRISSVLFLGSIIIVYFCITGPIYSACGIAPSKSKEMFSVPLQQLATVAKQADNVSEEELAFIESYVPNYSNLKDWIADPVKKKVNSEQLNNNPLEFFEGYIKIGLAHMDLYTNAFFRLEFNYLSPIGNYIPETDQREGPYTKNRTYNDPEKYIHINEPSLFPVLKEAVEASFTQYVPLYSLLYQYGIWFWVLLLFFILACYTRKREFVFWALFIICYWITVILGPVGWFRYALPLMFSVPLLLALFYYLKVAARRPNSTLQQTVKIDSKRQ